MTSLEQLVQAAMAAPEARRLEALRILRGEAGVAHPAQPAPEPYLTMKALAKAIGVDPCTLWRWGVPGHDMGGRRRFRLSEVDAYLQSDGFKRRAAALRAERKLSAKEASKQPTPMTTNP